MASKMDSSDSDDYNTDDERRQRPSTSKKAKITYTQKFRYEWLQNKDFKSWLTPPSKGSTKPYCSVCSTTVPCNKSGLVRHVKSASHSRLSSATAGPSQKKIEMLLQPNIQSQSYPLLVESRIGSFIAENNLPINISQPLLDLIKACAPQKSIEIDKLSKLSMSNVKCANMLRQGLGLYFSRDLVNQLRETKFSIIPDETTDISTEKQLAISVSYFDYQSCEVVNSFYDMVSIEKGDAESLYNAIKASFEEKKIPLDNIIGFSSDTCNVMFGEHKSVTALMKKEMPHILFVRCSCHVIHLCASNACLKLSTSLEDLCRNVYSHFSRSSLRRHEYEEFQHFLDIAPHKLLSVGQTRWLSLEVCVRRLLEQWDALKLYFTALISEKRDPSYVTESILTSLNNPFIKAQLQFMQMQLHRTCEFNKLFQSDKPMLHSLHSHVENLLREILSDFIILKTAKTCDPFGLDIQNINSRVPIQQVYVGMNATETLSQFPVKNDIEGIKKFKQSCQAFQIELVEQIRARFDTKPFRILEYLMPENALKRQPSSLGNMFVTFPYLEGICDKSLADVEWRQLSLEGQFEEEKDASQFWKKQLMSKNQTGELKYPNLRKVVGCGLSLPHSNASVERIFSNLRRIKTEIRSSLKNTSLVSLLYTRNGLKRKGIKSHELTLDDQLRKDLENVKSNATDEEAKTLYLKKFQ